MEGLSRPICPTEWNLGFGLGANEIESGGRRDRGGGDESEEVSQISQRDFPPGWSHPPLSQNRPTPTTYFLTVFLHLLLTVGHFGRRHFDNAEWLLLCSDLCFQHTTGRASVLLYWYILSKIVSEG